MAGSERRNEHRVIARLSIRAIMSPMPLTRRNLTALLAAALLALLLAPLAGAEVWSSGTYVYDGAGNITRIGPDAFSYDRVSRLGAATILTFDGTAHTQSYSYDVHGNIVSMTTNGQPASMPQAQGATNRLVGYDYDAAGNQRGVTSSPYYRGTFDAVNMMSARTLSAGTERYLYTADDERIAVTRPNGETLYTLRGLDGKVLREFKRSVTGTVSWEKDYIWRGGSLLATIDKAGLTTHYHLDHLGTPRLLTDATGEKLAFNTYYPFGREIDDADPALGDRMKFTGHERDAGDSAANALDYMHARSYGPNLGRFLSVDPAMDLKKIEANPQAWNRYSYVSNNPIAFVDPDGRETRLAIELEHDIVAHASGQMSYQEFQERNQGRAIGGLAGLGLLGGGAVVKASLTWFASRPDVLLAAMGWGTAMTGGPTPVRTGQIGEELAGIVVKKIRVPIPGTLRTRIPDELTAGALREVKNVAYQARTLQLRDFLSYAQSTGIKFILQVRENTQLSKPLRKLVDDGLIELQRILPK
jgi:RHS repeat-associated protein